MDGQKQGRAGLEGRDGMKKNMKGRKQGRKGKDATKAHPVSVTAPMSVARKVDVMCTLSSAAGSPAT